MWNFVVAEVEFRIIGAEFLRYYGLLVDVRNSILLDATTFLSVNGTASRIRSVSPILVEPSKSDHFSILAEFPTITNPVTQTQAVRRNVTHHILTQGLTVYSKPHRFASKKCKLAKSEFDKLLRPSLSNWASSLHMVPKKTLRQWRLCGDHRALKKHTIPDHYRIPHIQDFTASIYGATNFSKIDIVRDYNQIPVDPKDVPKTVITAPFGFFQFKRMPLGLRNAVQNFQRFMDQVVRGWILSTFTLTIYLSQVPPQKSTSSTFVNFFSTSPSMD